MTPWHLPPVYVDLETQSAADLKAVGGREYAAHPTTRIMTCVVCVDDVYHVWIPCPEFPPIVTYSGLWSEQLGPQSEIHIHHTPELPQPIADVIPGRLWLAHNAWGFDEHVWEHCVSRSRVGAARPVWGDTLPVVRGGGLAGSLDRAAKAMHGGGKDSGGAILRKYFRCESVAGHDFQIGPDAANPLNATIRPYRYPVPTPGDLGVIVRYNLADVALMRRLWEELTAEIEADVLDAHRAINDRGVMLDVELIRKIQTLGAESVGRAADRIAELTASTTYPDGQLNASNLRSIPQVRAWLAQYGLQVRDHTGKQTLRKDVLEQALANPWLMLDDDSPVTAAGAIPPHVFEVLRLRAASLRITGAKAERALLRASPDGRARDSFSYWQAHTGRWSSAGIQVHNLPRGKDGINVPALLALHESGAWSLDGEAAARDAYDLVAATLPPGEGRSKLTVDDALSALLRPIFVAAPGKTLLIADYNAIECRGLAWLAGEGWLLDAFRERADPYCEMASVVFGRPISKKDKLERQIGKVIVLACGYGMSPEKFAIYCGLVGVDLEAAGTSAEACVDAYRKKHPRIAGTYAGEISGRVYRRGGIWDQLGQAAMQVTREGGRISVARTEWFREGETLVCELPSGRRLRYRNARIEERVPGYARAMGLQKTKPTVIYDSDRGERSLYGGKVSENLSQSVCRDILADALVRLEATGLPVVMHIHDEIVCEVDDTIAEEALQAFVSIMATAPTWAEGFPLWVEGFSSRRYLKTPPAGAFKCERGG